VVVAENNYEQEAKFYIANLSALESKLQVLEASLKNPRVFETNLRFDFPDRRLTGKRQVLRLRQDERARLTFKGPTDPTQEVSARPEIEFEVSSFANARALLEALGYEVSVMYEKYRTSYELHGCEVTLDELPYGTFAEIEGPDVATIRGVANLLGLKWTARSRESYLMLFEHLRRGGLSARNLSFDEVSRPFPPEALGLAAADE
jgi:adenylate cyclase class 2